MSPKPVILFDGICNFCNGSVNFIIREDRKDIFRFAAFQSEAGEQLLKEHGILTTSPESFVLVDNGKVYQKSTAFLRVMKRLPWYWKEVQVLWIIPTFLRDIVYDFIARNRYEWFGKRDQCMIPGPDIKKKFL